MARKGGARIQMTVNGRKTKDWSVVGHLVRDAILYGEQGLEIAESQSERFLEEVKKIIQQQNPSPSNWEPLAESTQYRKAAQGYPLKTYIETGSFIDGLRTRKVKGKKDEVKVFAGASPYETHAPSGLSMEQVATYLEWGTSKIPARPLFMPARARLLPLFKSEYRNWWRRMKLRV